MNSAHPKVCVLTIAGSDSAGTAGIQADLKTFAAFGLHGVCAATAVTAQNMQRVESVHVVPAREVERQLAALFADFRVGAVKIGMLGSAANVTAVAATLRRVRPPHVVLDPVLTSSSGTPLLAARALSVLRKELIPLADVLTPNLPEAETLLQRRVRVADAAAAARDLLALGARAVLLKGGHGRGRVLSDVLAQSSGVHEFRHERLAIGARGTGCVLSSAIAAGLAQGQPLMAAVTAAQEFLQRALRASYRPGRRAINALDVFARS
jgi:hydroxymethylpyrimidine/phosphomethylpyrimidine kinase